MHKIDEVQGSLEKASEDKDNKVYMVHSQLQVCWFDKVKEWYVSEKIPLANPTPKSNDALYFDKDECFFIEFKNTIGCICHGSGPSIMPFSDTAFIHVILSRNASRCIALFL